MPLHAQRDRTVYSDDASWLRRVQQGDQDAAHALVERLYPTVLKSVRCHRPRQASEEDLAQAVFAKVFRKLHQFSGLVPLEHWVSRITVNTCISQLSRENGRPELRMSDLSETEEAAVELRLRTDDHPCLDMGTHSQELLSRLLNGLKAEERLVITLLHLEERSTQEISALTGWSVSLVKVKAFRARNKMRKLWNKLLQQCKTKEHGYGV
jgi:RNA polymerase sigma-70 factor (ECF subfamily)